jgi:hypothetical protein
MPLFLMLLSILPLVTAAAQDWNLQIVDDSGNVGHQSQIVVTSDGTPYIAYVGSSNALMLAWWVEDAGARGWNFDAVSSVGNSSCTVAMVVDPDDQLHLTWTSGGAYRVRYGVYDPAIQDWILGPEDAAPNSNNTWLPYLILVEEGPDLVPHIVFNKNNGVVRVTRRDPGSGLWDQETISETHEAYGQSSIGADSSGGLHVSFYEPVGDNLMYAHKASGGSVWALQTVDTEGNVGAYSCLVIDDADNIHIAYYDDTNGDLKFASSTIP